MANLEFICWRCQKLQDPQIVLLDGCIWLPAMRCMKQQGFDSLFSSSVQEGESRRGPGLWQSWSQEFLLDSSAPGFLKQLVSQGLRIAVTHLKLHMPPLMQA